jgi:hypothetical protein
MWHVNVAFLVDDQQDNEIFQYVTQLPHIKYLKTQSEQKSRCQ